MNTNKINNKNLKRIAIAAGTSAVALFLSAGLVACDGQSANNVVLPAKVAEVADAFQNLATEVIPATTEVPASESNASPVVETKSETTAAKAPATKKTKAKKSPVLTGGLVTGGASTSQEAATAPAPETTVAPAPQVADVAVVEAPAAAAPAEQPAVNQPAVEQAPAPAPAPSTTSGSTWLNIPKIIGTPNLASKIASTDLSKITTTITLPKPCLPGISC